MPTERHTLSWISGFYIFPGLIALSASSVGLFDRVNRAKYCVYTGFNEKNE